MLWNQASKYEEGGLHGSSALEVVVARQEDVHVYGTAARGRHNPSGRGDGHMTAGLFGFVFLQTCLRAKREPSMEIPEMV